MLVDDSFVVLRGDAGGLQAQIFSSLTSGKHKKNWEICSLHFVSTKWKYKLVTSHDLDRRKSV